MKLRYIVDIDIDEEDTEMEFVLKNDIKDFIQNHEYGYMANYVDVKFQDEYCIKEEQKKRKILKELRTPKKTIFKKQDPFGDLILVCPNCENPIIINPYNGKPFKHCIECGQALKCNPDC